MTRKVALPNLFELAPLAKLSRRKSAKSDLTRMSSGSSSGSTAPLTPKTPEETIVVIPSTPAAETPAPQPFHGSVTLEPWLVPLREAGWQNNLSAFLPRNEDTWKEEHRALVEGLKQWNLPVDPYAGAQTSALPKGAVAYIKKNVPAELRNTAYSYSGKVQDHLESVVLSSEFLDALARAERHARRRMQKGKRVLLPRMPDAHFLWMAQQLPPEFYSIYATQIGQADLERVITAVFILQCRQRFAATARASIKSRPNDRIYRVLSGVFKMSRGPESVPTCAEFKEQQAQDVRRVATA